MNIDLQKTQKIINQLGKAKTLNDYNKNFRNFCTEIKYNVLPVIITKEKESLS